MKINVNTLPEFDKEYKKLNKKYPSLREDLLALQKELIENPQLGTDLGGNLRKIRLQIKSKGKGKSGGARVISYYVIMSVMEANLYLVTMFDKSEMDTLKSAEIKIILKNNELM